MALQWKPPTKPSVAVEASEARVRPHAPWKPATAVTTLPPPPTPPETAHQWKAPSKPTIAVEAIEVRVRPHATWGRLSPKRTAESRAPSATVQALAPEQPLDLANAFLEGITGGLDSDRTPGLGKSRYEVRPVSADDITSARELINSATPSAGTTLSNHRKFETWKAENPSIRSNGFAIAMFATQAAKTLSPGTASHMATAELNFLRSCGESIRDFPLLKHIIQGLDLRYAQEGANHALDITDEEAGSFLPKIKRIDVRALVWLMLTCGARDADLLRLVDLQMTLHLAKLELEFRVTKTSRTVADKRHVSFPFVHPVDQEVRDFLSKPHTLPVCDTVNKVLKAAKLKVVDGRSITTYSFRRLFDQRVIAWYTDHDGCTDWLRVIAWSGHTDTKIVASTYAKCKELKVPKKRPSDGDETQAPTPSRGTVAPQGPPLISVVVPGTTLPTVVAATQPPEKKSPSPLQDAVKRMFRRVQN